MSPFGRTAKCRIGPSSSATTLEWNPFGRIKPSGSTARLGPHAKTTNQIPVKSFIAMVSMICLRASNDSEISQYLLFIPVTERAAEACS